jgi:hypothetical protein
VLVCSTNFKIIRTHLLSIADEPETKKSKNGYMGGGRSATRELNMSISDVAKRLYSEKEIW